MVGAEACGETGMIDDLQKHIAKIQTIRREIENLQNSLLHHLSIVEYLSNKIVSGSGIVAVDGISQKISQFDRMTRCEALVEILSKSDTPMKVAHVSQIMMRDGFTGSTKERLDQSLRVALKRFPDLFQVNQRCEWSLKKPTTAS